MTMPKGWKPPRQDDTTGSKENKQWLIAQLQLLVDDLSSEILSGKQLFLDNLSKVPKDLQDARTVFISLTTAVLVTAGHRKS
jgi:hypothetical protein